MYDPQSRNIGRIILMPFRRSSNFAHTSTAMFTRLYQCIGVDISERKSVTERTKKRKKWELAFFHHQGHNWCYSTSSRVRRYTDFVRAMITRDNFIPVSQIVFTTNQVCTGQSSDSERTCDRCQCTAVTPQVNLSFRSRPCVLHLKTFN